MDGAFYSLMSTKDLPLGNKRVLVTAPRQYASRLVGPLVQAGARPIWIPTIETCQLADERRPDLKGVLADLESYDHLCFTSRNGIEAVLEELMVLKGGFSEALNFLKRCRTTTRIWALGADATALSAYGVDVDMPQLASTSGLVSALNEKNLLKNRRILCPVPLVVRPLTEPEVVPNFLAALKSGGAHAVVSVSAYETRLGCTSESCKEEKAMLEQGGIDVIMFTSTAEAQGLAYLVGGRNHLSRILTGGGVLVAAHGNQTAVGVEKELGIVPRCINKNPADFKSYVSTLEEYFAAA